MKSTQDETEDILNSLVGQQYIDLSGIDTSELDKYKCDDVLQVLEDSQKLIGDSIKSNIIDASALDPSNLMSQNRKQSLEKQKKANNSVTLNTSTEINIIEEDEIPSKVLANPIDFVNYIEYQLPREKTKTKKNTFILKKHEISEETKFEVSEMQPQTELSSLMLKTEADITVCIANEDNIITGDVMGEIKFYSLTDKKLGRTIPCPFKNGVVINCIALSDDGDFAFAGFKNGNIAMYDLTNNKCKLVISEAHKKACINLKFVEITEQKMFKIFSSDIEGGVKSILIKSWLFGYKVDKIETIFEKKKYPTFLIHLLKFKDQEIKAKSSLKKLNKILILGNLENIQIFTLGNPIKNIYTFDKPSYIRDYCIPDLAIGLGKQPTTSENDEDDIELQLLFALSWEKVVYLYIVPILNKQLTSPILIGNFVNDNQIIRVGFITKSTVYIVDKKYNFKILNTRKFNMGNIVLSDEMPEPIASSTNNLTELQKAIHFDSNIMKQLVLKTPTGSAKETYLYSIFQNLSRDDLNVLTNNTLYNHQLFDYQRCLKELQKKGNWMELLILGMKIYQGKMTALSGIPLKVSERKGVIGEYLQNLISQFLFTNTGNQQISNNNKSNYYDPSLENAKIENNMEIAIEFCIEIESVNYLLDKILKMYESKGYRDIFLAKLEPFILCNKIIKAEISEEILLDIIKLYESKKKFDTLSQLLLHINIKSLDTPQIRQRMENLYLTTPMIYLYVNGKNEDYFEPINRIYEKFLASYDIPNFVSYENLLSSKTISLREIKMSRQYIGHQLLWYIKRSLSGKKFPHYFENMDTKIFHESLCKITYWLLSESVLNNLIRFDYKTYFEILTYIFTKDELVEVLEDNNNDDKSLKIAMDIIKKDGPNSYSYADVSPSNLAYNLIEKGKRYGTEIPSIFLYICDFIIKVGNKLNLPKDLKNEAAKYIIEVYQAYVPAESELKKVTNCIIDVIDNLEFTENDYRTLLSIMKTHTFDEIKFFLYKKIKYYNECIELLLDLECNIPEKAEKLFSFINLTLTSLKLKKDSEQLIFQDFKKAILNNLIKIGSINIDHLYSLLNTWFAKEKREIFLKFQENPEIELKYIQILVDRIGKSYKDNENNLIDEDSEWVDYILKLHIKLLCDLNKREQVLPSLKKYTLYQNILDGIIKICEYYGVDDALIYLYQIEGAVNKALDVCIRLLENNYISIFENLSAEKFSVNIHDLKIMEFSKSFNVAVDVLEQNERALVDNHDLWFTLLDKLYYLDDIFEKQKLLVPEDKEKCADELKELISNKIKQLLEKMSSYVGIKKLLDIISSKNINVEFKEFKPLLLKMLHSFGSQSHILKSVSDLLSFSCLDNQSILQKLNIGGRDLSFDICDVCKRSFNQTLNDKDKVIVFKCNHIQHITCAVKNEGDLGHKKECYICKKNEIENSITSNKEITFSGDLEQFLDNKINIKVKNTPDKKNKINIFNYKRGFNRMKDIDKNNIEKRKLFFDDSANSCRDFYRRDAFE